MNRVGSLFVALGAGAFLVAGLVIYTNELGAFQQIGKPVHDHSAEREGGGDDGGRAFLKTAGAAHVRERHFRGHSFDGLAAGTKLDIDLSGLDAVVVAASGRLGCIIVVVVVG